MEQNIEVDKRVITQDVINLYQNFTYGDGDIRRFMKDLSSMVGGMGTASSIIPILESEATHIVTAPDDKRLDISEVVIRVGGKDVYTYGVTPRNVAGELPCVVVVHENCGLSHHVMDVARQIALEGYIVLAPDAASLLGRRAGNDDEGRQMIQQISPEEAQKVFLNAIDMLINYEQSSGQVALVGFGRDRAATVNMATGSIALDEKKIDQLLEIWWGNNADQYSCNNNALLDVVHARQSLKKALLLLSQNLR